ncbi:MAG: hypothetical protein ACREHC_04155 [Candidatus Levyibacteriota bacterium]
MSRGGVGVLFFSSSDHNVLVTFGVIHIEAFSYKEAFVPFIPTKKSNAHAFRIN